MIPVSSPCYPSVSQGVHHLNHLYTEVINSTSSSGTQGSDAQLRSFMCNLSILKEKVNQVQSYVNIFLPQQNHPHSSNVVATHESTSSMAVASMGTMIQEIIVTASSMMFNCQQMALGSTNEGNHNHHQHMANNSSHIMQGVDDGLSQNVRTSTNNNNNNNNNSNSNGNNGHAFFDGEGFYSWYTDNVTCNTTTITNNHSSVTSDSFRVVATNTAKTSTTEKKTIGNNKSKESKKEAGGSTSILLSQEGAGYDIVELDAADLLAKYTHYCQVCGKGFKRDANLRMHMRAHGDEYKSSAALSNPLKKKISTNNGENSSAIKVVPRKYSCPHEGCRWNKKHAKFQPLKSIICVKNHYKRSHCPKMYVCKRCNRKQFSVLSDLRTHEKHCGDLKWQCSCGTTFSRKDKLMGHVTLFVGHSPMVINNPLGTLDKLDTNPQHGLQIHFKDR